MPRLRTTVRRAFSLTIAALLAIACDHDGLTDTRPLAGGPLPGGIPLEVQLTRATEAVPMAGLPRLSVRALAATLELTWEVAAPGCLLASATAERANGVVAVTIARAGNPLANCVAGPIGYRYVANVTGVPSGQYQVRLIDAMNGQAARIAGQVSVTVPAAP